MSTNPHATIVGVFSEREMAEQALNALKDAGFESNQLHYSGSSSSGGFFKSLFAAPSTTNESFVNELADLGVPDEETRYYNDEYHNGHSIVAVTAQGKEHEALTIMQRYGAYNGYRPASTGIPQPANAVQQGTNRPTPTYPPVPQQGVPPQAPPPPPHAVQGPPRQESQQAPQAPQAPDTLQALQAQLAATQKQIQDAQLQLQAAKQREAQLQAARQHDAQIQETQKRLQDAQAQLQATLAELRATQGQTGEPK